MILDRSEGIKADNEQEAQDLTGLGYKKCYGRGCNFFLAPDTQATVQNQASGYYTCPHCYTSHDLMENIPWHGVDQDYTEGWETGGGTRIGLTMDEQAQIGEDLIRELHSLPGYGPILWWHEGAANSPSPLDGATKEWGLEVKTIGYDAVHHRFIPGREQEKQDKNRQAEEMKLKGILGVLVLLNYRTSMADVYVKEMPLEPWTNATNRQLQGVASFRSGTGTHLLERVPFKNPLMDPHSGAPHSEPDLPF